MDVTFIGAGRMAHGIGTRLATAGAHLQILARAPEQAQACAAKLADAAAAGKAGEVVTGRLVGDAIRGEVVVLAVQYPAVAELAGQLREQLDGRIVVDITNPVDFSTFDSLLSPPGSSGAEEIAKLLPGARLVKAFNTIFAGTLVAGSVAGQPLDVFIASDDPGAVKTVSALVEQGGMRPVEVGPLRRARELEPMAFLHMLVQEPLNTQQRSALKIIA